MPLVTFDDVWESEFAPPIREKIARRASQQSEAFLEVTLTVAGEEIRQMWPEDLLMLDGFGSPFVTGGADDATRDEVEFFIWQLHPTNNHTGGFLNHYRRGLVLGRLRKRPHAQNISEIKSYCARMFSGLVSTPDEPTEGHKSDALQSESRTYFLAPLLVSIASEIGHIDPMSGRLLSQTPLPRLLQYQEATRPERDRGDDEVRAARAKCAHRMNELNWESREAEKSKGRDCEISGSSSSGPLAASTS